MLDMNNLTSHVYDYYKVHVVLIILCACLPACLRNTVRVLLFRMIFLCFKYAQE